MALEFENKIDEWQNEGTEPSDSLKESGFSAGYKPPASVFNRLWNTAYKSVDELQSKLSEASDDISDKLSQRVGGTVSGAVRFEGDITAVGENGIYVKNIKGYGGLEINGDYIGITSSDSSGSAGSVDISGNISLGGGNGFRNQRFKHPQGFAGGDGHLHSRAGGLKV